MIKEQQLIHFIQEIKSPLVDKIALALTDSYIVVIPLIALYILYKKKNFYNFVLSVIITFLIVIAIKNLVLTPRPCAELQVHFIECKNPLGSFPSMHTALVFVPVLFLLSEMPVFVFYLIYAISIGITRIYLGAHYPHDVFAGALIGILISYVCINLKKKN